MRKFKTGERPRRSVSKHKRTVTRDTEGQNSSDTFRNSFEIPGRSLSRARFLRQNDNKIGSAECLAGCCRVNFCLRKQSHEENDRASIHWSPFGQLHCWTKQFSLCWQPLWSVHKAGLLRCPATCTHDSGFPNIDHGRSDHSGQAVTATGACRVIHAN